MYAIDLLLLLNKLSLQLGRNHISGLVNKVAITPANTTDAKGLKNVCPKQGAIYLDKAYCNKTARKHAAKRDCHLRAIKKNNMSTPRGGYQLEVKVLAGKYYLMHPVSSFELMEVTL